MTVLAFSDRCRALQTHVRTEREESPPLPGWALVGRWVGAGAVAGACLGALLGVVVIIASGLWPVALLGVAFGSVPGAIIGAGVGALDGIVLRIMGYGTPSGLDLSRRRQGTVIVAATTTIAGFAILYPLFGSTTVIDQLGLVYAPVTAGTITAAVLSRRLD